MEGRRKHRNKLGCVVVLAAIIIISVCTYVSLQHLSVILEENPEKEEVPYQKVTIQETSLDNKYYYQKIPDEEKECYKEILQGLKEGTEEIYVHSQDVNQVNHLFQFVLKDYPELFWCDGSASSTSYQKGTNPEESYTVLKPSYIGTAEERQQKKAEIEAQVNECLSGISYAASDYEKILYVYEYIVNMVDYDENAEDNQNIYSVFVNKRSVCAGYAKATQYLLENLGVFCTYVTGTIENQGSHAWNLVQCEGEYYYVDTTWGAPVYQQAEGTDVPEWENISYDYMCCGDDEIYKTHTPDRDVEFPACTSMKWNYYVVNGMYYDSYDEERIMKAMNDVIGSKENPVVLKFSSQDVYQQAKDGVFQDLIGRAAQNLCRMYGLRQAEYYYQDSPELYKITIYWKYE